MSAALKAAVEANDPAAVREALGSVPDVNAKLFNGRNAVAVACALGADRALAALLDVKAKVQGKYIEHPFVIAAENQRHAVMQLLFDRKKVSEDAMETALTSTIREGRNDPFSSYCGNSSRRSPSARFDSRGSSGTPR